MDKVQFNNQMVLMRKIIRRVKVHLVNHLLRQVRVCKKKKGTEQQLAKNTRRAERLLAEIEAMKDLHADEITRIAAGSDAPSMVVVHDVSASAEQRALARLINHKLIMNELLKFKDLVTPDLLEIGKKRQRKLVKERAIQRAEARKDLKKKMSKKNKSMSDSGCNVGSNEEDMVNAKRGEGLRRAVGIERNDKKEKNFSAKEGKEQKNNAVSSKSQEMKKKEGFSFDLVDDEGETDTNIDRILEKESGLDEIDSEGSGFEKNYEEKSDDGKNYNDGRDSSEDERFTQNKWKSDFFERETKTQSKNESKMKAENNLKREKMTAKTSRIEIKQHLTSGPRKRGMDSLFIGTLSSTEKLHQPKGKAASQLMEKEDQTKRQQTEERTVEPSPHRRVALVDQASIQGAPNKERKLISGINDFFKPTPPTLRESAKDKPYKPYPSWTNSERLDEPRKPYPSWTNSERLDKPENNRKDPSFRSEAKFSKRSEGRVTNLPAATKEVLHPSWEAKKKEKEKQKTFRAFEGKKVVFDD